jgi:hypothetical protein
MTIPSIAPAIERAFRILVGFQTTCHVALFLEHMRAWRREIDSTSMHTIGGYEWGTLYHYQ